MAHQCAGGVSTDTPGARASLNAVHVLQNLLCWFGWHKRASYYDEEAHSMTFYCSICEAKFSHGNT